jgi:plastocyanin
MRHLPLLLLLTAATLGSDLRAQGAPVRAVRIGVLPGLHYDTPRFAVAPGESIELRFVNDDEMPHNFLLTRPGQRLAVVQAALALGADGPLRGWVPDRDDVLHAIAELGPGKEQLLRFTAPIERGVYPYVCTYPGHGFVMYGAMYVGTPMPEEIAEDQNCSPAWREGLLEAPAGSKAHEHHHPGQPAKPRLHAWPADRRPLVYRIFMPDCSPAAFAVALPGDINYCWDATSCRLRYAWHGDFVDPMPVWKGNGNGLAKILGERWVTLDERCVQPTLANGAAAPTPEFLGHRRIDGHPEFRYRWGRFEVREMIRALPEGAGLSLEMTWRRVAAGTSGTSTDEWTYASPQTGRDLRHTASTRDHAWKGTITLTRPTDGTDAEDGR